jgi:type IV secretion system protein VirB10
MSNNASQNSGPGSLQPAQPSGSAARKSFNIIIAVIAGLFLILLYSLVTGGSKDEDSQQGENQAAQVEPRRFLGNQDEGRGVAAGKYPEPPKNESGVVAQPTPQELAPPPDDQIIVVGPPKVDPDEEERKRLEAEDKRKKREAHNAALTSKMMARSSDHQTSSSPQTTSDSPGSSHSPQQVSNTNPDAYDPAADRDKEQFFQRAEVSQWMSPYTREAGHPYELKTGSVIPAIMITGVNSDLPGNLIAQVSQNVFNSATGQHLLIPQGAKLYGVYDSRVVYGQERVLIAWNRVVFPDGSSVTLGAMPGADMSGYAGFHEHVNNHYFRIFGSAILMSLLTGGAAYAMDASDSGGDGTGETTMQDEMISAMASQLGQTTLKLLEKNINIKPTIGISPGYRFNIITTKDVVFREPYNASPSLKSAQNVSESMSVSAR